MKEYRILLTALLKNRFRPVRKTAMSAGTLAYFLVIGAVFAYFIGIATWAIAYVTPFFAAMDAVRELVVMILIGAGALVVVFGVTTMISYVYFNSDTEFLAALPVRPSTVFLTRLTVVYLIEFVTTFAMLVPTLLTVGILSGAGALFYIGMVIALFVVPAIPLLIASLLAIPLMYAVSFFKNKGAWSTVALMLVFILVMGATYLLIIGLGSTGDNFDKYVETFISVLNRAGQYVYPYFALASFMTEASILTLSGVWSALAGVGIALGSTALLTAATVLISSFFYRRSILAQTETAKNTGKTGEYVQANAARALLHKEWREIVRTPTVGFQCLFSILISPLFVLGTALTQSIVPDLSAAGADVDTALIAAAVVKVMPVMMLLMLSCSVNSIAASMISREGTNFYVLKIIPVDPLQIVRAKINLQLIVNLISIILSWLVLVFVSGLAIEEAAATLVIAVLFCYAGVTFAAKFEIDKPRLEWDSPIEVIKNSRNAMLGTLPAIGASMFLAIMMGFGMALLAAYPLISYAVNYGGAILISASLAILCHRRLYKNINSVFQSIE